MNQIEKIGMNKNAYFFDTYAFFEILRGNPKYENYQNVRLITTIFNIAELNYNLKKEKSKETADLIIEKYKQFIVPLLIDDIKKAMDLKIKFKNLSIPDAVGYTVAKRHGLKFLTGDEDFRNFENVEFVK
jgi:predicted nucleic acid-binding protein